MNSDQIVSLPSLGDERGNLVVIEGCHCAPFEIKRVYYLYGTKPSTSRGYHAHRSLKQMAVCVSGSCSMVLDNGKVKETILLNSPMQGVIIEEMVWHEMHDFSEDCVLLVLASDHYDESDYIRNYNQFLQAIEI